MTWRNIRLVFMRELRDQLRDRRTLFTVIVLPLLLYPLLGIAGLQILQFNREHPTQVLIVGEPQVDSEVGKVELLTDQGQIREDFLPEPNRNLLKVQYEQKIDAELALLIKHALQTPSERNASVDVVESNQVNEYLKSKSCELLVVFPTPELEKELGTKKDQVNAEGDTSKTSSVPQVYLLGSSASEKSRIASSRIRNVLERWSDTIVMQNLERRQLSTKTIRPFKVEDRDVAPTSSKQAIIWSKILPFVMLIWALTGAFYPAIDSCAGEKERGTFETLLCSAAQRSEIVIGKLLTVWAFSVATASLNLISMTLSGSYIFGMLSKQAGVNLSLGAPPIEGIFWLFIALLPASAWFSALSLSIAAFAKSTKEGQYYLMPLLLISLPLMMIPMMPQSELDFGKSLIPITGLMLLLRDLIEGNYWNAFRFSIPVLGVTLAGCVLAVKWCVGQFNKESVLFRESEQISPRLWLKSFLKARGDRAQVPEALFCGFIVIVIHYFGSMMATPPTNFEQFARTTVISLAAFIAMPAILMAVMLTTRPLKALGLTMPAFWTLPAAALLAIMIHPLQVLIGNGVVYLYPLDEKMIARLSVMGELINGTPLFYLVLVIALTPAIFEEIAFRGFILRGLLRWKSKASAIVVSSLLFGVAHGFLQQSLTAFVTGLLLGFISYRAGSILPTMVYHFVHNALPVFMLAALSEFGGEIFIARKETGSAVGFAYHNWYAFIAIAVGLALIYLFARHRPKE